MRRTGVVTAASLAALALAGLANAAEPVTQQKGSVGSAIATPVEDLNLTRTEIPAILVKAQANPYDVAGVRDCAAIAGEIARLDEALGADKDVAPSPKDDKGPSVGTVLKTGVQAVIPYRGVVRLVSGASAHEKSLTEAIRVGFARRGFLKGRAIEMNCPAPASPKGFIQRPELAAAPLPVTPAPDLPAAPLYTLEPAGPSELVTAAPTP